MIIKLTFLAIIFGLILFIIRVLFAMVTSNQCQKCNGEGYWKETRGERNFCKDCNGTGQVNKKTPNKSY